MRPVSPVGGARHDTDAGTVAGAPAWHALPVDAVVHELQTDPEHGLTPAEADRRLQEHGPNELTPPPKEHALLRLAREFTSPLVLILLGAVVVTAALQEWVDAGVILAVVIVNAVIGFVQESRAVKALDALSRAMTPEATVVRAGERRRVSAADLVPGDLVALQSGDKVPADLRIVRSRDIQVDESMLTGETHPVEKHPDAVPPDTTLGDRHDMAYASTLVSYGQATGTVVATADDTELGRIAHLLQSVEELQTPLTRRIAEFSRILLAAILALAALTFLVGLARGESAFDTFLAAVALAVAAIPEGLPAAMTIVLAIGLNRMARRRAIIRKLPAVETLGSTTVVCSDKTGTLTANEMTVQEVVAGGRRWQLTGTGYEPDGELRPADGDGESGGAGERGGAPAASPLDDVALRTTLLAGVLCNDTALVRRDDGPLRVEGDPTEAALLVAARKAGLDLRHEQATWPRLDTVPFESQHKYMATLHRHADTGECAVFLKGAVEAVLPRCGQALQPDGSLGPVDAAAVEAAMNQLAGRGLRVLALATGHASAREGVLDHDDVAGGLVFCGLQAMIDPPRPAAVTAVRTAQRAGIRVKMITGDHPVTAFAVGRQLGLEAAEDGVLTGADLATLDDAALSDAVRRADVFARVTPEQKLRLVEALQRHGQVVAMTGDGVNDAPALKQADIGVAMGLKGTDAAKDAADMVLTDDNFASIEAAVEEGRGVFDNLTKFIVWTLPTNVGEGGVVLAAVLLGVTLPVLPLQILWINMTTAVLLGLMLAFEAKEPGIMSRPPRDPDQPVLTRPLIRRILVVGGLLVVGAFGLSEWLLAQGRSEELARTVAVNVFVMGELAYLHACRSLHGTVRQIGLWSNPWVWIGSAAMLGLQLAFTYAPPFQSVFETAGLGATEWLLVAAVAVVIASAASLEKRLERRRGAASAG